MPVKKTIFLNSNLPNMKTLNSLLIILSAATISSGCASIVSKSNWPVSVQTNPSGANVIIVNKKGVEVFNGTTPTALKLKSGSGFFGKESYVVTLNLTGYAPKKVNLECKLNGWYFGNILLGGIIGMLIVDPATGAMYKLESDYIDTNLTAVATTSFNDPVLKILDRNDIPKDWETHLVKLK